MADFLAIRGLALPSHLHHALPAGRAAAAHGSQASRPLPPPAAAKATLVCTGPHSLLRRVRVGPCVPKAQAWVPPCPAPARDKPLVSPFREKNPSCALTPQALPLVLPSCGSTWDRPLSAPSGMPRSSVTSAEPGAGAGGPALLAGGQPALATAHPPPRGWKELQGDRAWPPSLHSCRQPRPREQQMLRAPLQA